MRTLGVSRRRFLTGTGALAGVELAGASLQFPFSAFALVLEDQIRADYTLQIKTSPIEIAPKRIISAINLRRTVRRPDWPQRDYACDRTGTRPGLA